MYVIPISISGDSDLVGSKSRLRTLNLAPKIIHKLGTTESSKPTLIPSLFSFPPNFFILSLSFFCLSLKPIRVLVSYTSNHNQIISGIFFKSFTVSHLIDRTIDKSPLISSTTPLLSLHLISHLNLKFQFCHPNRMLIRLISDIN